MSAMSRRFLRSSWTVGWTGLATLLCATASVRAQPDPLRVGTSGDYAPFSQRLRDGETAFAPSLTGFDVELARTFARDRGTPVVFVPFRWPELLTALGEGRFDIAMSGVTVRPERSLAGRFSVPTARSGALLIVRGDDAAQPLEAFDQPGVTLAVNRGGHLERAARARFPRATIQPVDRNQDVLGELLTARARAAVTDTLEAPHWLARSDDLASIGPFTRDDKAALLPPDRTDLAHELDAWLLARERDGTLARLRAKYFDPGSQQATATPALALEAASAERLALMPLVAEAKRDSGAPVEDLAREQRVLTAAVAGVEGAARKRGVEPPETDDVVAFFRTRIERAKQVQRQVLDEPRDPRRPVVDLATTLRPALLRIGDRIAMLLVEDAIPRRGSAAPAPGSGRDGTGRDATGDQ